MESLSWYQVLGLAGIKSNGEMPRYRVAICGPPSSGKTTLASLFADNVRNTDALIEGGFDEAIDGAASWLSDPDMEIIEGAIVPHALRRWMRSNPGRPVDRVIWLGKSHEELNQFQNAFGKGCRGVFEAIVPEMQARGITVIDRSEIGPVE